MGEIAERASEKEGDKRGGVEARVEDAQEIREKTGEGRREKKERRRKIDKRNKKPERSETR